ncbi:MAG TPA: hypothetical protein VK912_05745 [Longimicrobiales bacterium]|nr:hypothetical protein [Longimicrobiales bacterium]
MSVIALAIQSEGLTLNEVVNGIPHDGPAIVVYAMLLVFVGFIWRGSRKKSS